MLTHAAHAFTQICMCRMHTNAHTCNRKARRCRALSRMQLASSNFIQRTQQHRSMRSRRRGVRFQRRSGVGDTTLSSRTPTHWTKRTRHAHNARPRVAACIASGMRAAPRLALQCLPTVCTLAVLMGRTSKRSRDGAPCCQRACKQDQG